MEENPFPDLKISSSDFLNDIEDRAVCPKCEKSRKYYCYNCYVPTRGIENLIPRVQIPFHIDIIKHPNECDGKSTSAHAAILAPDHVRVYTYPCIPDYPETEKVVLVFPGPNSLTLEELAIRHANENEDSMTKSTTEEDTETLDKNEERESKNVVGNDRTTIHDTVVTAVNNDRVSANTSSTDNKGSDYSGEVKGLQCVEGEYSREGPSMFQGKRKLEVCTEERQAVRRRKMAAPFTRAVFIDSTWNQTRKISADERLKGFTRIELKTRDTKFWRHQQDKPTTYLATVEAVYYLVRDYHDLFVPTVYEGEYDNLLFFFNFMYQKIKKLHHGGKDLKAFKQRSEMNKQKEANKQDKS